jgi:hypothetical protein
MSRETMCAYGNCHELGDGISVNVRSNIKGCGERKTFCCAEHAGLWLLKRAYRIDNQPTASERERIIHTVAGDLEVPRVYR